MPRDIPIGNGQMLVTFDHHYQVRDLYYPHVGQENHAGGGPCRFGVYGDVPDGKRGKDRRKQRIYWTYDGWTIDPRYQPDTLATDVRLSNDELKLSMRCSEVVDFHRCLMVRRITLTNHVDKPRTVRLFHHNDFHMFGTKVGDTAYFDPQLRMMVHYREKRYLMIGFMADGELRTDQYATGNSGFGGAEGTWRDAEDGVLGMNPVAQGAVDSTIALDVALPAKSDGDGNRTVYLIIGAGHGYEELAELHHFLHREGPQGVIDRTEAYWRLWCWANNWDFDNLPEHLVDLFRRSLLVLRTQIDNDGAILAANDSDIMQFSRDTYSYLWPRDGALVAHAMDIAGYPEISRRFYHFCSRIIVPKGYFLHKYNADGSPASSWHPWVVGDRIQLPIQEDETALVLWALWRHYYLNRDIEFVRPLWMRLIQPAADFMVRFRDPATNLPLPSYDLWEERFGIHAFTVGSVFGAFTAAANFAVCFGDKARAERYRQAAAETREAFKQWMWSDEHDRYLRRIEPTDLHRSSALIDQVMQGRDPAATYDGPRGAEVEHWRDTVIDSALYGIYKFGMLPADDPGVRRTMERVERELWIKTDIGGLARYADDAYHRVSDDVKNVPGNPWFICTLWMADWRIAAANDRQQLDAALPILQWAADHTADSGVLAEQVHPLTGAALSVSPLTWSHATYVGVVMDYLEKLEALEVEAHGEPDVYRMRGRSKTRVRNHLLIDKFEAIPLDDFGMESGASAPPVDAPTDNEASASTASPPPSDPEPRDA